MTRDAWQDVLDAHGNRPVRTDVVLRGGALGADEVAATIEVSAEAAGPVEFGDNLYGATAWAPDGDTWRRADTAEFRLMIVLVLQPGERADVTLPLAGAPERVRVLVGGNWTELSR